MRAFLVCGKAFRPASSKSLTRGERMKARYRVHRFNIRMTSDQSKLEQFLNGLEGEVVAIVPNVTPKMTPGGMGANVDFLLSGKN
jgi:hypothetical protein